jgi:Ni/Co efflux regulator RcnB
MHKPLAALMAASAVLLPLLFSTPAHAATIHQEVIAQKGYWDRGYHLSPIERRRVTTIDYRRYRLPPPMQGYRWVRVENRFLLVGINDGLVADVIVR